MLLKTGFAVYFDKHIQTSAPGVIDHLLDKSVLQVEQHI